MLLLAKLNTKTSVNNYANLKIRINIFYYLTEIGRLYSRERNCVLGLGSMVLTKMQMRAIVSLEFVLQCLAGVMI